MSNVKTPKVVTDLFGMLAAARTGGCRTCKWVNVSGGDTVCGNVTSRHYGVRTSLKDACNCRKWTKREKQESQP